MLRLCLSPGLGGPANLLGLFLDVSESILGFCGCVNVGREAGRKMSEETRVLLVRVFIPFLSILPSVWTEKQKRLRGEG